MITLGGYPLLIPDEGGELAEFLRKHNPWGDASLFSGAMDGCPRRRRYEQDKGVGLPQYNWPDAPPLCINSLYWPTGASRFARGLFLATYDTMLSVTGHGNSLTLKLGDDAASKTIETSVYVLEPRQLAAYGLGELWLIPVVDVRYWWQRLPVPDPGVGYSTTWANLFATIDAETGIDVEVDEVDAAYLQPCKNEWNRKYGSVGEMLDAAAASVGQRIVRDLDGTVRSVAAPDSAPSLPPGSQAVAGGSVGNAHHDAPFEVEVAFRRVKYFGQLSDEQVHSYTNEATVNNAGSYIHTVYGAACADFSSGGLTPDNNTELAALAAKIAEDFYAWRDYRFGYTLAGVVNWPLTGLEDAIVWEFGKQDHGGELLAQTRVWSLPADVAVDTNAAGDPDIFIIEPRQWAVLQGAMSQGGSATTWVVAHDGTDFEYTVDPQIKPLAYDFLMNTGESLADDTKVRIEWDGQVWSVVNALCVTSDTLPTEPV